MSYNLRYLCGSIDKIHIICHITYVSLWFNRQDTYYISYKLRYLCGSIDKIHIICQITYDISGSIDKIHIICHIAYDISVVQ